ncbi:Crp/Fnr family transcriptional regulator [Thiomicrorhabdus lithotrophica]|uniref:Cyclic nucleotide-binding domain-containing protein n=1 Tax=Thiomicrorhabdus lithotrophica TaxID=2949997 RepID=A0ABY8CCE8_9GAMM|nr:cyclic nucleotide-binding domain-containing protein [Thiomicrorhabdus lithotrophica]WEJ63644.1 cyclic nucleotide-binding domain-containing protein [Thiomicrorhabdus lithotrophica]
MISMSAKELFKFFQEHSICESLTIDEVGELMNYLQEKEYAGGEVISDSGEVGEALGFIINGKVEFTSFDGQDTTSVGKQGVGTLIGEMSFFDRKPRNLRMQACKKGVKFLVLTRPMYDRLKVEQPYIVVNILENAIVSLDNLVRHMGDDISALGHYMHGFGKR